MAREHDMRAAALHTCHWAIHNYLPGIPFSLVSSSKSPRIKLIPTWPLGSAMSAFTIIQQAPSGKGQQELVLYTCSHLAIGQRHERVHNHPAVGRLLAVVLPLGCVSGVVSKGRAEVR